jgi:SAM-dependent methyltransferase
MALGYCKLCELEDFAAPELRDLIAQVPDKGSPGPGYPAGQEDRKPWEIAMTLRSLRDFGAVREDAEILGVGAGREATIFWLTNYVRRVFATDLYASEDAWSSRDSGEGMLARPTPLRDMDWNPKRLVVQHMSGLDLSYEDDSFDGIFSSGSIEHFGTLEDIRGSVAEMYRVLKPGGVCALATEFRLEGPEGIPGTHLFTADELNDVLFNGLDWQPASPLDLSISAATLAAPIDFAAMIAQGRKPPRFDIRGRLGGLIGGGRVVRPVPEEPELETPFPHIVLSYGEYLWTSVHVALIKPG